MTAPDAAPKRRLAPLDGVRGVAVLLVVLSHGWALWPMEGIKEGPLVGLFRAGNAAVTVFLVVGGFLLVRSLLARADRAEPMRPHRLAARRFVRVSAHVYALVVAVLVVHALDESDAYSRSSMRDSVVRIVTYTWNWFLRDSALLARPDLGHLWYVCVYLQVTLALILLVTLLRRHRDALVAVLAVLVVAVTWWRGWVVDHEGLHSALLRTTTRMDGMLWGALGAALLPRLRGLDPRHWAALAVAGCAGFVGLVLTTGHDETYFHWSGVALNVAVLAVTLGLVLGDEAVPLASVLAGRPLVALGGASMAVFVWHYPAFWAVARHTASWSWPARTVVALAITAVLVVAAQRAIERPLAAWLARQDEPRPPAATTPADRPTDRPDEDARGGEDPIAGTGPGTGPHPEAEPAR